MMMHRFHHAMRLVLPPDWLVAIATTPWILIEFLRRFQPWWYQIEIPELDVGLVHMRDALMISVALAYGYLRATSRHPYYQDAYRQWLEATPWTAAQALPIGPIQLVWQDAVLLLVLAAGMYDTTYSRWFLLSAFAVGYLLPTANALFALDLWKHGYSICFLLGLGALVHLSLPLRLAVIAVTFGVAWHGVRSMLRAFPWRLGDQWPRWFGQLKMAMSGRGLVATHGWPHGVLAPTVIRALRVEYRDGILISLLAGWLLFVIGAHVDPTKRAVTLMCAMYAVMGCACVRVLRYAIFQRAPQSRLGMLLRGRPIAPRYDVIFLPPLLTVIIPLAAGGLLGLADLWLLAGPVTLTLGLLIALNAPPSYADWALTGDHRTVAGGKNPQVMKEI